MPLIQSTQDHSRLPLPHQLIYLCPQYSTGLGKGFSHNLFIYLFIIIFNHEFYIFIYLFLMFDFAKIKAFKVKLWTLILQTGLQFSCLWFEKSSTNFPRFFSKTFLLKGYFTPTSIFSEIFKRLRKSVFYTSKNFFATKKIV